MNEVISNSFMKEKITLIALLTTIMMMATSMAHANLITNGNFDTFVPLNGTGGGWTTAGNDFNGGWTNVDGNSFFIINAAGESATDPSISQILNGLTIGQVYDVSGNFTNYYNCCGNPTALSFGVDVTPGGLLTELADPGSYPNWFSFSTSFTATQTSHTVRFTSERNGDDTEYAIDNISVVASVPEPATLGLMGLGLVGMSFARRLRQQGSLHKTR